MTLALLVLLKATVALIIFAIGMESTPGDAIRLLRNPGLLLRSLLAMYVLVPMAALALVTVLTLQPGVEIGLLVLAVSAGAPLLPRKLMGIGDGGYAFSLVVISSILAVVIVPAWIAVLGPYFGAPATLTPVIVAWVLAKSFFLPLIAGMLVRWWFPALATRFAARATAVAGVVLMLAALALLGLNWEIVLHIKWEGVLTLAALIVLALAIGHLLGGPADDDRTALAIACATRHIGVAVMVATSLPGPRTIVILAVYITTSVVISLPYLRWRRVVAKRSPGP
ncbi:bile acid:sodium symporter family protein [Reyranella sp.]|uniref:bile acid:sodium symporter family protein n=1 Tax=Reyranella sp. TaxID=1929291 RepID=UPI003D10A647